MTTQARMFLLHCVVLFGLLHRLCDAQVPLVPFTVELTEAEITDFEGEMIGITARLEGQIHGEVDVELRLLTVSQFRSLPEGAEFTPSADPAESSDFGHDNELVHTFEAVSSLRQMYTFEIDILDDDRNELEEEFVALIDVTGIQNEEQDIFDPDISERLYITITIGIDPDNPDKTLILISSPDQVTEGTMEWPITLEILGLFPEDEIGLSIDTQSTSNNPAMQSSDYDLLVTSVTITSDKNTPNYVVTMNFTEDDIPEPQFEQVEVTFSGDRVEFDGAASITVTIRDNDELLIGFIKPMLEIREGETGEAMISILNPSEVAVSIRVQVQLADNANSKRDEQPEPQEFELSQDNRQQMFQINIPNDHVVDTLHNHKRSFTLEMVFSSGNTDKVNISSSVLEVVIKDNDTDIEFGIRDAVAARRVVEGGEITITVGFLGDSEGLKLDDDFVVGYSVKMFDAGDALETTEIPDGVLNRDIRTHNIIIKTKSNEEVQEDNQFFIVVQQTSDNSPLVKLQAANLTVIIEDDDIFGPNKPVVRVERLGKEFQISWNIVVSDKYPVRRYRIELEIPNREPIVRTVDDPKVTSITQSYEINDVDYSMANISVRVCAINDREETCSDRNYHRGAGLEPPGRISDKPDNRGLSGGAIAAIVIVLLLLLGVILIILLLLFLYRINGWKSYFPPIREEKYEEAFASAREEFSDDV